MRKPASPSSHYQFTLRALYTLLKIAASGRGVSGSVGKQNERQAYRYLHDHLEPAFGCDICKPGSNPTVLTKEGHELAKIASEFFAALTEFQRKCHNQPPNITVGGGDSIIHCIVLPALKEFWQEKISFSVRMGGSQGLIALLRASQMDFAIVPEGVRLYEKWKCESVGLYEYCVCCPKHFLARKKLNRDSLSKLDFALMTDHWQLDFVEKARRAEIQLNVKFMCETFTQVATLVNTGLFAAILPLSMMSSFSNNSFRWFKPTFLEGTDRTINLVWKHDDCAHIGAILPEWTLQCGTANIRLSQQRFIYLYFTPSMFIALASGEFTGDGICMGKVIDQISAGLENDFLVALQADERTIQL